MSVGISRLIFIALAASSIGAERVSAAALRDDALFQKNLSEIFASWLKDDANVKDSKASLPDLIDLTKGKLEFPTSTTARWVITLPEADLGAERQKAEESLKELLVVFLMSDSAKQALESTPEATLKTMQVGASAQIVDKSASGKTIDLPEVKDPNPPAVPPQVTSQLPTTDPSPQQMPSASPQMSYPDTMHEVLASPQSINTLSSEPLYSPASPQAASYTGEAYPAAQSTSTVDLVVSTRFNTSQPVLSEGRVDPYELYWSGNTSQATLEWRARTTRNPSDASALYFQALSELASGDRIAADLTLQMAAATEAKMKTSRQVSRSLVRVQGPVRDWVETARRNPSSLETLTRTAHAR